MSNATDLLQRPVPTDRLGRRATTNGDRDSITVRAPFTGETIGQVPAGTAADVERAVERSRAAAENWRERSVAERGRVLDRFAELVRQHRTELLDLAQLEGGKSRDDATNEWADLIAVANYYADRAPELLADERRAGAIPGVTRTTVHHDPVGVVGVIAPWNYPLTLAVGDALPALMAGNGVVLKPAEQTPFTALRLAELLDEAGLPSELFGVVTGRGAEAGAAVTATTDYVSFTGSTAVGREVGATAGERLIGASLELGGKGPMIVLPDANLDRAVRGAVIGGFDNAGQLCIATERIYVHESVFESFRDRLVAAVEALTVGPGFDFETDVGSMISDEQLAVVERHVSEARDEGATVAAGGERLPELGPLFYAPTVLTDVSPDSAVACEETFGPVVTLESVESIDEAVARANDSPYGLHGSVYGPRPRAERVARRLDTGTVTIDDAYAAAWLSTDAPMGGRNDSGLGRRHGPEGLLRFTESQTIARQRTGPLERPGVVPGDLFARGLSLVLRIRRQLDRLR